MKRADNFGAIRLAAAVLVIFGHSFPLVGAHGPGLLGSTASTFAVKVFFVISGYLISDSWVRDPNVFRYFARRILRIFPALAVLCAVTVFAVGPALTSLTVPEYFSDSRTWRYFANAALYPIFDLPGVFARNIYPSAVNGSLWTLPVEFALYMLTPILLLLPGARHIALLVAAALSAASIVFARTTAPAEPVVFFGTNLIYAVEMVPYFFWGAVYRLWMRPERLSLQIAMVLAILSPLFATDLARAEIAAFIAIPYVTLAFGHATPPVFAVVGRHGDFSYGTYLYGFLVQQIVAYYFAFAGNPWANFAFSMPLALFLAFLSWRFVERPALRLKPR